MFGNLIKILLLAVIIASVALFARDRLQPPAPDNASAPPAEPAGRESAASSADTSAETKPSPEETVGAALPGPDETDTPAPSVRPQSAATEGSMVPEPSEPTGAAGPAVTEEQGDLAEPDTDAAVPEAAPSSTGGSDALATAPGETVESEEETEEPVSLETVPALPLVHPGPEDTSLPPPAFPEQPPLTQ